MQLHSAVVQSLQDASPQSACVTAQGWVLAELQPGQARHAGLQTSWGSAVLSGRCTCAVNVSLPRAGLPAARHPLGSLLHALHVSRVSQEGGLGLQGALLDHLGRVGQPVLRDDGLHSRLHAAHRLRRSSSSICSCKPRVGRQATLQPHKDSRTSAWVFGFCTGGEAP